MSPLWSKTLRFGKILRQLTAAALGLLLAAPAFAQGASPWENAVGVLQQAFTSIIARGHLPGRNRGIRPDLRLRRRRLEASARGCSLRGWHGHRRRQLHGLAFSVRRVAGKTI
jgi:hypothetical protein